jgi:PAS domain S-box-containing protein
MADIGVQLFQSFSDAMPLGACFVDAHARIVYWNTAAEGITGYLGAEVLGRAYRGDLLIHCAEGSGESLVSQVQCPIMEVLRDGKPVVADLFLLHKFGHRVAVHVYAFPLRGAMGEMLGVGEILDPSPGKPQEITHAEFEMATGLPAMEKSHAYLQAVIAQQAHKAESAAPAALIAIDMSEHEALLQHGGTTMLHQAVRVLARTVAGLVPARTYIGCWSDWRLVAIIPECSAGTLEAAKSKLAGVGSSCAVKWWGDRVVVGIRVATCYLDAMHSADQSAEAVMAGLEHELRGTAHGEK